MVILWLASACRATPTPTLVPTPTPTPTPPPRRSLSIAVHDAENDQPIADAQITVGEQDSHTDPTGTAVIEVPYGSVYIVQIVAPGYKQRQDEIDAVQPGTDVLEVKAALEPTRLAGRVTDLDGKVLSQAQVGYGGQTVGLDAQGRFELLRVQPGSHVSVVHPGYVGQQIEISEDQSNLLVALEPLTLTVTAYSQWTGHPVEGVSLCSGSADCLSTDDTGSAQLEALTYGTTITATHPNYKTPAHQSLAYVGQNHLQIHLAPRELVSTIRDASTGEPISRTILLLNGQILDKDLDGRYRLPDPTTPYTLFVKSPGYERVEIAIGPETRPADHDALIECADPEVQPCLDISLPDFAVHGIYANFGLLNWQKDLMLELIDLIDRSPILNAIVVDVKSDYGYIAYESQDPLISQVDAMTTPRLPLDEFLALCREKGIYTIARMVIFKDSPLIAARPELAVRHPDGEIFFDREGMAWADPTREEVWDYNIAITKEVIEMGFDEIQYDYLRYPSDSTSLAVVRALVYSIPSTLESRTAAIQGFVKAAKAAVDPTRAFLSADLFGYALVVTPEHDMRIGQRLIDLAPHVDYVCPMIYPSTFESGNLDLADPSSNPYEVIKRSMASGMARTDTVLRPWLQGYWYERQDFVDQRKAAEEATAAGWCFWNARGEYDEGFFVPSEQTSP
jgi:hypothetical protein